MFTKLFTTLFGTTDHEQNGQQYNGNSNASHSHKNEQGKQSLPAQPKLSDSIYRLRSSRNAKHSQNNAMKTSSYWVQHNYDGHESVTPQQQISMLYAPHIGPIGASEAADDEQSNSPEGLSLRKDKALTSYLAKSNQEILAEADRADQMIVEEKPKARRTEQEILRAIANHPDVKVRECIAENELAPVKALWALSDDESALVRTKLALNINCPTLLLELLSVDADPQVAQLALAVLRKRGSTQEAA